jgi:hypothetical protein
MNIGKFFCFVVYHNGNVLMHQISTCIMSSCIMLYHQHKYYGTYVLIKEGWGNFQNDYIACIKFFIDERLNVYLLYYNC